MERCLSLDTDFNRKWNNNNYDKKSRHPLQLGTAKKKVALKKMALSWLSSMPKGISFTTSSRVEDEVANILCEARRHS